MDGKKLSEDEEDEDEQFLVEEAVPPPKDVPEMQVVSNFNSEFYEYSRQTYCKPGMLTTFIPFQEPAQELDSEDKHGTQSFKFSFILHVNIMRQFICSPGGL